MERAFGVEGYQVLLVMEAFRALGGWGIYVWFLAFGSQEEEDQWLYLYGGNG